MKKITSEDCVNEIDKVLPGKKWKRVSKKTVIEREFEVVGQPSVKVLVREDGGKLSVSFGQYGEPLEPEPNAKRLNEDDYYFQFDNEFAEEEDADFPVFNIVTKDFWDRNHHFDDGVNCSNVKMPAGFCECMEGTFEFNGTKEEGTRRLVAAGFIPLPENDVDKAKIEKDVISGILFSVIPMRRDGSDNVMVWFADKNKFLKYHKKEDRDYVLTCDQRDLLNEAMGKAGFVGGEVEDGADGFSLEYMIEQWIGHSDLISANDVRAALREIGFSEDPKYDKWVSQ